MIKYFCTSMIRKLKRNIWKKAIVITLIAFTVIQIFFYTAVFCDIKTNYENYSKFNFVFPNPTYDGQTPEELMQRVNLLLNKLPGFSDIKCSDILAGDKNEIEKAKKWKLSNFSFIWTEIEESVDQCKTLKQSFVFVDYPLSSEEAEYPIAYGALVYKDIEQVAYMLSSIYRPNNVYAFMVDSKASDNFKRRMLLFSICFPNIFVQFTQKPVKWGGHEIVKAVFEAVKILVETKYEWKNFLYITGFTLPLKTNLEMSRIFKELNGTVNINISKFPTSRLGKGKFNKIGNETVSKQKTEADSPLPLFKSNLAGTFPRETIEYMINSKKVQQLLKFLENTTVPDESIWGTITGNFNSFPIPGGFDGKALLKKVEADNRRKNPYGDPTKTRPNNYTFVPSQYYITRYHIWIGTKKYCQGKFVSDSCVFGVGDLPILITRPELVAHKFYFNFEPAAFFCLYQNHWKRTLNLQVQQKFNAKPYSNLAFVQASRGIPVKNITVFYM